MGLGSEIMFSFDLCTIVCIYVFIRFTFPVSRLSRHEYLNVSSELYNNHN